MEVKQTGVKNMTAHETHQNPFRPRSFRPGSSSSPYFMQSFNSSQTWPVKFEAMIIFFLSLGTAGPGGQLRAYIDTLIIMVHVGSALYRIHLFCNNSQRRTEPMLCCWSGVQTVRYCDCQTSCCCVCQGCGLPRSSAPHLEILSFADY